MTELAKRIVELAKGLPAIERATLIDELLETLDQSGTSVDAQWVKECKDRVAALERGEMDLVGFDEAMAELRRR